MKNESFRSLFHSSLKLPSRSEEYNREHFCSPGGERELSLGVAPLKTKLKGVRTSVSLKKSSSLCLPAFYVYSSTLPACRVQRPALKIEYQTFRALARQKTFRDYDRVICTEKL